MHRIILLLFVLVLQGKAVFTQTTTLIHWITLEEAQERYLKVPRPTMIFFYTDWCRFCKEMDRTTFSNEQIAAYINQNFYCVRFNAEGYDSITYQDTVYYNPSNENRSPHDFARKMLGSRLTYPTTYFLSNQNQFRFVVPGMVDIVKFEPMLVYVLENVFFTEVYEPFEKAFLQTFRPDSGHVLKSLVELTPLQQLDFSRRKLISIHAEWCNSCKVMNHSTFLDSVLMDAASDLFSMASMHIASSDTIYWYGEVYAPNPQGGVHPFISHHAGGTIVLPLILLFDEDGKLLTPLPRYQPPGSLVKVLQYFGEDHHLRMEWGEFLKGN